jgi:ferredoxin
VYDENRRFSPVYDDAQVETAPCDAVLLAVGQTPDVSFLEGAGVEFARPGWPKIEPATLSTTASGVFVAGDLAHGTQLLIDAVASGKAAARSVYTHLTGRRLQAEVLTSFQVLEQYRRERGYEAIRRQAIPVTEPHERFEHPSVQVEKGYDKGTAMREASRCLDCGVTPVFDGNRCVLCGGCADVCPTLCLKLVPYEAENSAILKDEDRCIRCALCAMRCPVDAITMERITFHTTWRSL